MPLRQRQKVQELLWQGRIAEYRPCCRNEPYRHGASAPKGVIGMIELDQYKQDLAQIRESITQAGESL